MHTPLLSRGVSTARTLQRELGDNYSRRKLTAAVFYPAYEDGVKANLQQYVITLNADEHGLRFPTDEAERIPDRSE